MTYTFDFLLFCITFCFPSFVSFITHLFSFSLSISPSSFLTIIFLFSFPLFVPERHIPCFIFVFLLLINLYPLFFLCILCFGFSSAYYFNPFFTSSSPFSPCSHSNYSSHSVSWAALLRLQSEGACMYVSLASEWDVLAAELRTHRLKQTGVNTPLP